MKGPDKPLLQNLAIVENCWEFVLTTAEIQQIKLALVLLLENPGRWAQKSYDLVPPTVLRTARRSIHRAHHRQREARLFYVSMYERTFAFKYP